MMEERCRSIQHSGISWMYPMLVLTLMLAALLSINVYASTSAPESAIDHSAKFRVTITYNVVNDSDSVHNGIGIDYYRTSYDNKSSMDKCYDQIAYTKTYYTAKEKGEHKLTYNLEGPPCDIFMAVYGDALDSSEWYVTAVDVEVISPVAETQCSKIELWRGKVGLEVEHMYGAGNQCFLYFEEKSARFGEWDQDHIGDHKTQTTSSYYKGYPGKPTINLYNGGFNLYATSDGLVPSPNVVDLSKAFFNDYGYRSDHYYYIKNDICYYDQYGAKWPLHYLESISLQNAGNYSIIISRADIKGIEFEAFLDANRKDDYTLTAEVVFVGGQRKFTRDIHFKTFDYNMIFKDDQNNVIATQTYDYGETVDSPDQVGDKYYIIDDDNIRSEDGSIMSYNWRDTKNGPQTRIMYGILSPGIDGSGTAADPYLIKDGSGWEFVRKLTAEKATAGKYFKLVNDISSSAPIITRVGSQECPFEGVFDGDGHNLYISYTNNCDSESRTAPFSYTRNATICNLNVYGTINKLGKSRAAGVLGENEGNTLIKNCTVGVSINGDHYIGGFCIGAGGQITIEDCVFKGKIIADTRDDTSSGFIGCCSDQPILRNCLFDPDPATTVRENFVAPSYSSFSLENCRYTRSYGSNQGEPYMQETQASAPPVTAVQEPVTIINTPKILKYKTKKNKVTINWRKIRKTRVGKKLLKKTKCIQMQYSTDPTFQTNVMTKTVGKKKTKTVLKLQRKTVYYIRVRYVAKDGGFSNWSKTKRVKTK